MSSTIRRYKPLAHHKEAQEMTLTSTVQPGHGHSMQFTIGMNYCVLSEAQLKDMLVAIASRLNCEDGYSATGNESGYREVLP